jgi:hypothetical protein
VSDSVPKLPSQQPGLLCVAAGGLLATTALAMWTAQGTRRSDVWAWDCGRHGGSCLGTLLFFRTFLKRVVLNYANRSRGENQCAARHRRRQGHLKNGLVRLDNWLVVSTSSCAKLSDQDAAGSLPHSAILHNVEHVHTHAHGKGNNPKALFTYRLVKQPSCAAHFFCRLPRQQDVTKSWIQCEWPSKTPQSRNGLTSKVCIHIDCGSVKSHASHSDAKQSPLAHFALLQRVVEAQASLGCYCRTQLQGIAMHHSSASILHLNTITARFARLCVVFLT